MSQAQLKQRQYPGQPHKSGEYLDESGVDQSRRIRYVRAESVHPLISDNGVARKSRQQTYCSPKCRARGHYTKNGRRRVFSDDLGGDSGLLTHPQIKHCDFNVLQWAKSGSSTRIVGPHRVVEAELFAGREWRDKISADGIRSQVSTLARRALVN
jgi:hypothetical protein